MAAGEVHPQQQILLFGNALTTIFYWLVPPLTVAAIFYWLVPPLTVAQPQVYKKQLAAASCDEKP